MSPEVFLLRFAKYAGRTVFGLATLVLLAWAVPADFLPGPRAWLTVMAGTTAFLFLFASTSLLLQCANRGLFIARILAAMTAVIGFLNFVDLVWDQKFWLDRVTLLAGPTGQPLAFPGHIATYTGIAFVAAGLALLFLQSRHIEVRRLPHAWLAIVVVTIGAACLLAAGFNAGDSRFDFHAPAYMAPHTAAGFLLLGLGIICSRPEDRPLRSLVARTAVGTLTRRLLIAVLPAPALVSTLLVVLVRTGHVSLPDGAAVLTVAYTLAGLLFVHFSSELAAGLDEKRRQADHAQEKLTDNLQLQAAQLQEIVAARTHELSQANLHLQALNQRLELATRTAALGVWEWDAATQRSTWDARTLEIYGVPPPEFHGTSDEWLQHLHPDDRPAARATFQAVLDGANEYDLSFRVVRPDGGIRHVESRAIVQRDSRGRLLRIIGTERDFTIHYEATQAARTLNERLQLALRSSNYGVWEWDVAGDRLIWDNRMFEIYGLSREQFKGVLTDWSDRLYPADVSAAQAGVQQIMSGKSSGYNSAFRIVLPDGSIRHIKAHGYLQRNARGEPVRLVGLNRDVTAEQTMLDALLVAEHRWQLAIEGSNDAIWDWNMENGGVYRDDTWMRMLGYGRDDVAATVDGWRALVHPDDLPACEAATRAHLEQRTPFYQHEYRMRHKNGGWKWILDRGKIVSRAADGRSLRMVGTHSDITSRKNLEHRLKRTDELGDQVGRLAHIGGWEVDFATSEVTWSTEMYRIHEVDENTPLSLAELEKYFPPDALKRIRAAASDSTGPGDAFDVESALFTARGRPIWVRVLGRVEHRAGQPPRIHGALQDITAQHEAEAGRHELEVQLFHAQKMETLGTLSGGIAHDFNNLLTGIIGHHELAADSLPEDHPARACLAEARTASLRARELVEQILTFGRPSTEANHGSLDLGMVIEEARRFLRATLPANILIETDVDSTCSPVLADATQLHQILLNLGSNAAHAMRERGGVMRIGLHPQVIGTETTAALGHLARGNYVRLSMSDTGHGMDEITLRRIFEPFFTTKNTREGTGLGLAVVHGIVRDHRGAIDVRSKPDEGTTFEIYLPAGSTTSFMPEMESAPAQHGAGERICVVDDEGIVGRFTKATLERKGYQVMIFSSAEECLLAFPDYNSECHVLVTDQTMPGIQGTDLAAAMRKRHPQLPVVIMSGYFSKIPVQALDELGQVELLAKPFTTEQLIQAVQRALEAARRAP